MVLIKKLRRHIRRLASDLTWPTMMLLLAGQTLITYALFAAAGEAELIHHPLQFLYYNMVVISTVGFGDLSPVTDFGKMIVLLFQIPSGLIIFATFIGKTTQLFTQIARSNMNGNNDFSHFQGHILLLCWDKDSTEQIINLILGDHKRLNRKILLCVTDPIENPFPDVEDLYFARLTTFSDPDELKRIAISQAERIIVDGKSDDEILSIALSISTFTNKNANISAHFFDKTKANLLKTHCPQIECSTDTTANMLVRSMQDPGSSQVTERLLSTLNGATLYCLQVPEISHEFSFDLAFSKLKNEKEMILVGLSHFKNGDDMQLNPAPNTPIKSGDFIHYIANERITAIDIDWNQLIEHSA